MSIRIRTIRPSDQVAVMDLHREHYWRSHCLLLNPDFYRWQFVEPPESLEEGGDQSIVAVDDDGQLLSYLGLVPMPASCCGRSLRAAHLITWLTPPVARGRGVGMRLMSHVVERFDFLFGRSVTPAALAIYQRLGFRYFRVCSRWAIVLDAKSTQGLAVDPSETSAKRAAARAVRLDKPPAFSVATQVPLGASALFARVLSASTAFKRSQEALAWRYEKHPYFRYVFLTLGELDELLGVAVVREEDVRDRLGKVLRVVEFVAQPEHSRELAEAVAAFGLEHGCAFADVFGMSEHFVSGLVSIGGFNLLEEPDLKLPYLFQPWDADRDPPGLLFYGRRDGLTGQPGPVDDVTRIYVSKGDGNMDWPSWVPSADGHSIAPPTRSTKE